MLKISRTTEPTEEPITIEEAKLHLRVDGDDEDMLIMNLIIAARELAEETTWRAFCTQTWRLFLDDWPPSHCVTIPRAPLQSVTHLKYTDDAGSQSTMTSTDYIVSANGNQRGSLTLKSSVGAWPTVTLQDVEAIEIEFVAGYGDSSDVPQRIKQALLLLIGHWYENREEIVVTPGVVAAEVPMAARALLDQVRAW